MINNVQVITPSECMILLKIGRNKMYDLLKQKDFPAFKIGSKYLINANKLEEWMVNQCNN